MQDHAYGVYNDLVLDLASKLVNVMPEEKDRIETGIFQTAQLHWAQTFFDDRTQAEKKVAQSSTGIVKHIQACLFPENQPVPDNVAKLFADFDKHCDQRFEDYNTYWHPFYQLQQSETTRRLAERSATIFDPNPIPGFKVYVMASVWRTSVKPQVESKIVELLEEGVKTSDDNIPMAVCLLKHMRFIDEMVAHAKTQVEKSNSERRMLSFRRL